MNLCVHQSISEIDPIEWDSLITDNNLFHTHWALSVLEKAKVENAKVEYILFYDNQKLIGTAVLNAFSIDLSLFIGENAFIQWIKKLLPEFFKVRILFCGTPISAGHRNIYLPKGVLKKKCLELLENHITLRCKKETIQYSVFKEFSSNILNDYAPFLEKMSYFKGYSIPNVFLDLPYKTYHEYLNNLKYGYRRQIKSSLKKIGATEPSDIFDSSRKTYFRIRPILECEPEEFHKLYMSVINRARIKLETLNLEFFVTLFKDQMDEIRSIELVDNDKLITAFIVAHQNDSLIFLWTAKEYDKDALDSYQNVMQAMIEYAIKSGCKRVVLGQTSYYPKMKVGGKTEELYILFKCHKKVKNMILKSLSNHIFPKFKVDKLHALKQ